MASENDFKNTPIEVLDQVLRTSTGTQQVDQNPNFSERKEKTGASPDIENYQTKKKKKKKNNGTAEETSLHSHILKSRDSEENLDVPPPLIFSDAESEEEVSDVETGESLSASPSKDEESSLTKPNNQTLDISSLPRADTPEGKKILKLQSCDSELFIINQNIINMCATVKNMLKGKTIAFRNSLGGQFSIDGSYVILKKEGRILASLTKNTEEEVIITLPDVKSHALRKVLEYCEYHSQSTAPEREKKIWDQEFVQVKQSVLCELASASYYLDIKPLVNLTSRAIANQISGKSSEEIRETFCNINYEVYAPVFANSLATRCRLQRKYNQKKQEREEKSLTEDVPKDQRSVDDLVNFINNSNDNNSTVNPEKKKKKKKKKKGKETSDATPLKEGQNKFLTSSALSASPVDLEPSKPPELSKPSSMPIKQSKEEEESELFESNPSASLNSSGREWADPDFIFGEDDFDDDDDLDPEMKEALDKEVQEFAMRLESIDTPPKNRVKVHLPNFSLTPSSNSPPSIYF